MLRRIIVISFSKLLFDHWIEILMIFTNFHLSTYDVQSDLKLYNDEIS